MRSEEENKNITKKIQRNGGFDKRIAGEAEAFSHILFNVLVKLLLRVPFMLIRPFYAYFYAKQAVFCLSAHQDLFMLVRPFHAYQRTR